MTDITRRPGQLWLASAITTILAMSISASSWAQPDGKHPLSGQRAQQQSEPQQPPQPQQQAEPPEQAEPQPQESTGLSQAELEQMLAPIALYPDTLLTHVLISATNPLEVVQAARWARANKDLTGEAAVQAVEGEQWDPSVKALVAFPQVLDRMSKELEWTQALGEAFLLSEAEVMESIQALRQQAYKAGNLDNLEHIKVEREERTVIIEPAVREVVYVPYYDSRVVYGDWRWHQHPPLFWDMPAHSARWSSRPGAHIYWSTGVRLPSSFYFSSFHWPRRQVVVVHRYDPHPWYYTSRQISRHRDAHPWRHSPHRRDTGYRDDRRHGDHDWRRRDDGWQRHGPRPGSPRVVSPPTPPRVTTPNRPSGPRVISGRPGGTPTTDLRTPPRGRRGESNTQSPRQVMPQRDTQTPGGALQSDPVPRASNNPRGRPRASGSGAAPKRHPVRGN